jgi:hypothetical protein
LDLCFVNDGMDTHHHKGDVTARTISPERAFLFARLRIGGSAGPQCRRSEWRVSSNSGLCSVLKALAENCLAAQIATLRLMLENNPLMAFPNKSRAFHLFVAR